MEHPTVKRPEFTKPGAPCYDYRNLETAGQYRGVGTAGKIGHFNSEGMDAMPSSIKRQKVPRDHKG